MRAERVPNQHSRQLLRTPQPAPDESLPGYLLRLSNANGYDTSNWVLKLAGLKLCSPIAVWRQVFREDLDLSGLQRVARVDEQRWKLLVSGTEPTGAGGRVRPYGSECPFAIRFLQPAVCPVCLIEKPYCRRIWDFSPVTVCSDHEVLLIDRCHVCRAPLSWNRASVVVCRCGADLRKAVPVQVTSDELRMPKRLQRAIEHGASIAPDARVRDPANSMVLGDLCNVIRVLSKFFSTSRPRRPLRSKSELPDWHLTANYVEVLLCDWPTGFHRFLGEYRDADGQHILEDCLHCLADTDDTAFLCVEFDRPKTNEARDRSSEFNSHHVPRRFASRELACRIFYLRPVGFAVIESEGELRFVPGSSGSDGRLIDLVSLRRSLWWLRPGLLTPQKVSEVLGVKTRHIDELVESALLRASDLSRIDDYGGHRFDIREILACRDGTLRMAQLIPERLDSFRMPTGFIGFDRALEWFEVASSGISDLLRAIISGVIRPSLQPTAASSWKATFRDLRFRRVDVLRHLKLSFGQLPPAVARLRRDELIRHTATLKQLRKAIDSMSWRTIPLERDRRAINVLASVARGTLEGYSHRAEVEQIRDA